MKSKFVLLLKLSFYIFVVIVTSTSIFGQVEMKVELSESMEIPSNSNPSKLLTLKNGESFLFLKKKNMLYLEHFNAKNELQNSQSFKELQDEIYLTKPFVFNDKIYYYGINPQNKSKRKTTYLQEVSAVTLGLESGPKLMHTGNISKYPEYVFVDYIISEDETTIAFYDRPTYNSQQTKKEIINSKVTVYDQQLQKVWSKDLTFPYTEDLYKINTALLDNKSNFYFLGTLFNDKLRTEIDGKPNFEFLITAIRNYGQEKSEYKISLEDKFITDCNFVITPEYKILCAGYFSNNGVNTIKGSFIMLIDPETGEVISKTITDFSADFLKSINASKKGLIEGETGTFPLNSIRIKSDGSILLIGERKFSISSQGSSTSGPSITYYADDIVIVNYDKNYKLTWTKNISKSQQYSTDDHQSYSSHFNDDILYIIYSGEVIDEAPKSIHTNKIIEKGYAAKIVSFNSLGEMQTRYLFSNIEEDVVIRPMDCEQINPTTFIIVASSGKKYKIGRVTFE